MKWVFLVLSFSASAMECDKGIEAFGKSVHPKIINDCMLCHGDARKAPPFASQDVKQSYYRLLNYTNFQNPNLSTLVVRAGNGHCKLQSCNTESGTEMLEKVKEWWEAGQKECPLEGKYFTTDLAMPLDLPNPQQGFRKLEWDLTPFGIQFSGFKFQLEVQRWAEATTTNPGAYRFRLPRLSSGIGSVHVKGLRILINRTSDPLATAYSFINQVTHPQDSRRGMVYPMLSDNTLITNQLTTEDRVSLSFDEFEKVSPIECKALGFFEDNIKPHFLQGKCASCHAAGVGPSAETFSTSVSSPLLCRTVLERTDLKNVMQSPFLRMIVQGKFQHPKNIINTQLFYDDFIAWIDREKLR